MFLNLPFTVVTYFAVYAINTQYIVHYFKQLYLGAIKNMKKKIFYFTFLFIFLVLIQASHLYHIPLLKELPLIFLTGWICWQWILFLFVWESISSSFMKDVFTWCRVLFGQFFSFSISGGHLTVFWTQKTSDWKFIVILFLFLCV